MEKANNQLLALINQYELSADEKNLVLRELADMKTENLRELLIRTLMELKIAVKRKNYELNTLELKHYYAQDIYHFFQVTFNHINLKTKRDRIVLDFSNCEFNLGDITIDINAKYATRLCIIVPSYANFNLTADYSFSGVNDFRLVSTDLTSCINLVGKIRMSNINIVSKLNDVPFKINGQQLK